MAFGNRGNLSLLGNIMQINNAFVEEVSTSNNVTGSILISYVDYSSSGIPSLNFLRLNVNRNTAILNLAGESNCLCDIQEGMWVDAMFSPRMTRSIPPQSNAFLLLVRRGLLAPTNMTTARIISTDNANRSILKGNPKDRNNQTLFIVTDDTIIRNRSGNPISLSDLQPGQMARIVHANFQTANIPPQTTAFYIQLL